MTSIQTRRRLDLASEAAQAYGGVLSRVLLRALAIDADVVRRQVSGRRWAMHGRQTVAMHTGDLDELARRWRAIWEVGAAIAALDGVTALQHGGMTGFADDRVHVSVLHRHSVRTVADVAVHKVRHQPPAHVLRTGIPRVRPAVAAIRGAHWAVSDRQAALILCMPVQQRLVTGEQLLAARASRVWGRTRRRFIDRTIRDIALGAESLGELDFAASCRLRGLPEPERQVRRRGDGSSYLDVRWRNGLVVEIDGAAHRQGLAVAADNLRANAVSLTEDLVLRIDLVGLRLHEDAFLDQVCAGYWLCEGRRRSAR